MFAKLVFVAVVLAIAGKLAEPTTLYPEIRIPVKILKCLDGDTALVEVRAKFNVRFMIGDKYLDAPEKNTPAGRVSYLELERYCVGQDAMLSIPIGKTLESMASFSRPKGELWLLTTPEESLSEWQVSHHNAIVGSRN